MVKCIPLFLPNVSRIQISSGSLALIRPFSRFERLSASVNFERATRHPAFSPGSTWVRVLTACCLIFSVGIAGCVPAFLQKQTEIPLEKRATEKSELLKPKAGEVSPDGAGRIGEENPKISTDGKDLSRRGSANSASKRDKQDSLLSAKSKTTKHGDTNFNSDSAPEKGETSNPARRIAAKNEKSSAPSEDGDAGATKSKELFKRHNHAKYLEIINNKAVDLVNSDKESNYVAMCKDMVTDEWSLTLYYVKEKTYKFVTYAWDEIDDNWRESFTSDKRPLSGLKKHLKYSSAGKDCKALKKPGR